MYYCAEPGALVCWVCIDPEAVLTTREGYEKSGLFPLVLMMISVPLPVLAATTDIASMSDAEHKELKTLVDQELARRTVSTQTGEVF